MISQNILRRLDQFPQSDRAVRSALGRALPEELYAIYPAGPERFHTLFSGICVSRPYRTARAAYKEIVERGQTQPPVPHVSPFTVIRWFMAEAWLEMSDLQGRWTCEILTGQSAGGARFVRSVRWDPTVPPGLQEDEYVDD